MRKSAFRKRGLFFNCVFVLGVLLLVPKLQAATLTVTSLANTGPGSLRSILATASTGDTITFAVQGTITLTNGTPSAGDLVIDKALQIIGPGASKLLLLETGQNPVFRVSSNVVASISGLMITGNHLSGIWNYGSLTVTNCTIADCYGDVYGGGVQNYGDITVVDSVITDCTSYVGGGIRSSGGNVFLTRSVITRCMSYYQGGGIFCSGPLYLQNCSISHNGGSFGGGGIYGDQVRITSCTIDNNQAFGDELNGASGGGIHAGILYMTNSTVSGNEVASRITESADGGGIRASNVYLESCTIVSNTVLMMPWDFPNQAVPSPFLGGGISANTIEARNSIIALNTSAVFRQGLSPLSVPSDCGGTMISHGFNLIQSLAGLTLTGDLTGCLFNIDPRLAPLRSNGGLTATHALLPSSPAIDQGNAGGLVVDQRGFARPRDIYGIPNASDGSDIGAFEFSPQFVEFEAESGGITSPMVVASDPLASQGKYIVSSVPNSGTAFYEFTIPVAGAYVMWCRVNAATYNSDSFFVLMDVAPELIYDAAENIQTNIWQWTRVIGRTNGAPVDLNPRVFSFFTAGEYMLLFEGRDANTKLDRILLTSDTNYVPPISFEAESGALVAPMAILSDTNASHGQYIASSVAESGQASFTFGIPATNQYFIWCRVLATNSSADSFYVSMDGGPELIYDIAEGKWTNQWQWTRLIGRSSGAPVDFTPRTFNLDQKMHTLVFRGREGNSKLDRILLTSDPNFDPAVDFEPTVTSQSVSGLANADLPIWLWESAPYRDLASYKILTLPARGTLYQCTTSGGRGSIISVNDMVTDPSGRVIFVPTTNTCGFSYANFQFAATDGIRDAVQPVATIDIFAPPVHVNQWLQALDDSVHFRFPGIPGTAYTVSQKNNLLQPSWIPTGSTLEISPGLYEFIDSSAATNATRFFRVSWP